MAEKEAQGGPGEAGEISTPEELVGKELPTSIETEPVPEDTAQAAVTSDVSARRADTLAFAWQAHRYVRDFIRLADQKAAFLFAVGTGMLAFLNGTEVRGRWFQDPRAWVFPDVLAFLTVGGLCIAIVSAILVVLPRRGGTKKGIIFFDAIAETATAKEYAVEVGQKDEAALARETLQHCHELATVCRSKYTALNFAIRAGSVAAVALVLYYLVTARP